MIGIVTAWAVSNLASGQLPQRLLELLNAARVHSHALAISRAQVKEQEAAVDQAFAAFFPTLRASGGYTRNQYQAVVNLPASLLGTGPPTETDTLTIQPYNAWSGAIGINVPLFTAGNLYRYGESRAGRLAAENAEQASEAEVLLSTVRAYYRLAGAQGVFEAANRALTTAQDNLRVTQVRASAGTQTRLALDRARVDLARAEQTKVSANQAVALATRNLETLTGERVEGRLPLPDVPHGHARPEAAYLEEALNRRPEVQQAMAAVHQQELAVREAWAQLVPSLSASATETFTNITGFIGQKQFWAVGANAAWNVDPLGVRASIRRATAALEEQQHRLAQVEDTLRDEVRSAWLDVDSGAARLVQTETEMKAAEDALSITRQQYEVGTATSLDLSQAQRDSFNAEASFAQSRADLAAAIVALQEAAGEPFWLEATKGSSP